MGKREGEQIGEKRTDEKWRNVVAENEAKIAEKDTLIAELQARLGEDTYNMKVFTKAP